LGFHAQMDGRVFWANLTDAAAIHGERVLRPHGPSPNGIHMASRDDDPELLVNVYSLNTDGSIRTSSLWSRATLGGEHFGYCCATDVELNDVHILGVTLSCPCASAPTAMQHFHAARGENAYHLSLCD